MKKFTKQEIDGTRLFFQEQEYKEVKVTVGGRTFSYFVLPQSLKPALPDFVFRCTGNTSDDYVFGISDSVREDFRPYSVFHEYVEFIEIGISTRNRCLEALGIELADVPADIKPDYLLMRRNFFRNLINYYSARPNRFTKRDISELRCSLSILEDLVGEK